MDEIVAGESEFIGTPSELLRAIREGRVDASDVDLSGVTERVRTEIERGTKSLAESYDLLSTAAAILDLKTRSLLPKREEPSLSEALPEEVKLVEEFNSFLNEMAGVLAERINDFSNFYPPGGKRDFILDEVLSLEDVSIYDLFALFSEIAKEKKSSSLEIERERISIEEIMAEVEGRLRKEGELMLEPLLLSFQSMARMIAAFLALLELIKDERIRLKRQESRILLVWAGEKAKND